MKIIKLISMIYIGIGLTLFALATYNSIKYPADVYNVSGIMNLTTIDSVSSASIRNIEVVGRGHSMMTTNISIIGAIMFVTGNLMLFISKRR